MFKDTGGIDAASILLNLTDYRVISATHESSGRQVLVEPIRPKLSALPVAY